MRAPVQDPRAAILSAERHASMHEEMAEKWTLQAKEATDPVLIERYESWARRSTEHAAKHRLAAALAPQGEGLTASLQAFEPNGAGETNERTTPQGAA